MSPPKIPPAALHSAASSPTADSPLSRLDDPETLDRWIARFRGPLVGLIASWTPSWREAEETAQDTFAEAWVGRSRFIGDPSDDGAVGAWLRGIAFRLQQAKTRKRDLLQLVESDALNDAKAVAAGDVDTRARTEAMREAFTKLDDGAQAILRMHYLETTTAKDVAALLGLTQKAVEQRLARARKALKEIMIRDLAILTRTQARGRQ